jgi:uncharacterized membrane protein YccC
LIINVRVRRGNVFRYIGILLLCTVAGFLLAEAYMSPEGAIAGAAKGLFVGLLVALGEWRSRHSVDMQEHPIHIREHPVRIR